MTENNARIYERFLSALAADDSETLSDMLTPGERREELKAALNEFCFDFVKLGQPIPNFEAQLGRRITGEARKMVMSLWLY